MRALLAIFVSGAVLAAFASAGGEAGGGGASCRWRVVLDVPGPELAGVAALSDQDVWAVGDDGVRAGIVHWDGRSWRSIASHVFALAVTAVSAADVWAVGSSSPGAGAFALSEHWNGRRWRTVPLGGRPAGYLRAVAALSATDVWAVGADERGPLVEHWRGTAWERVPTGPLHGLLHGIDAVSPRAIWAVGTQGMLSPDPLSEDENPLIERWNGGRWQARPAPGLEGIDDNLFAVDAVSANDAWAVGSVDEHGGAPLVQRWDGQAWSSAPTSGLPATEVLLSAVAAFGPADVWVAGSHSLEQAERPLLAHWNGRRWSQAASPLPRGGLADLAVLSPRDIWAAGGSLETEGKARSLIEHYTCA